MQAVKRASLNIVRWFDSWAGTDNDTIVRDLKAASAQKVTEGATTKVKEGAAALKDSATAAKETAVAALAAAKETAAHATANAREAIDWARVIPFMACLLYTSPSPRDQRGSRMPSSA